MKEKFDQLVEHLLKGSIFLPEAIEILEKSMIRRSLEESGGNQCASSKQLGIHRNTLQRKMVEYGLGNGRARPRRKPIARAGRPRKRKTGAA
jgi:transcriptional regulator with PAS, ATPase and Fis domain